MSSEHLDNECSMHDLASSVAALHALGSRRPQCLSPDAFRDGGKIVVFRGDDDFAEMLDTLWEHYLAHAWPWDPQPPYTLAEYAVMPPAFRRQWRAIYERVVNQ